MKKVLILREKFGHMGNHSGYDLLFNFNGGNKDIRIKSLYLSQAGRPFWFKVLQKLGFESNMNDYSFSQYVLGLKTYLYTMFYRPVIIHFTFVEENLRFIRWRYLSQALKKKCKLVGTTHQPLSYWNNSKEISLLNKLDGLIILNNNVSDYFAQQLPSVRLFEVPHSVDIQFFKKTPGNKKTSNHCLFTGFWLRDFDCLFATIKSAAQLKLNLHFDLVIPAHGIRKMDNTLKKLPQDYITVYTGVSDDFLLQLLNNALCMFLPLKDATANNSLLEGLACELPVVVATSSSRSIYYQTESVQIFHAHEIDKILYCIEELQCDEERRLTKGKKGRVFVEEQFSLPITQNKILDVYRSF